MGSRLRHRLRKLWVAGLLKVGGRSPAWMTREDVQEAAPEEVRYVLDHQAEPAKSSLEALPNVGYIVGRDRLNGKFLISGEGCLPEKNWLVVKRGTIQECIAYTKDPT